jgi:arsenate reductase (thioredoxin)
MNGKIKILVLCTGNSCRSQMAEAFLKRALPSAVVCSAGTHPASLVSPFTIRVMAEVGIDISQNRPKDVRQFLEQSFDYVITVCDSAQQSCPVFAGRVGLQLHIGFSDPAKAVGNEEEILKVYRCSRDQICEEFTALAKVLASAPGR